MTIVDKLKVKCWDSIDEWCEMVGVAKDADEKYREYYGFNEYFQGMTQAIRYLEEITDEGM